MLRANGHRAARASFLLIAGLGLSCAASARDIHVCATCAHTTIQSAVDAAATTGDQIIIATGHYLENVTIAGKSVTLQGSFGGSGLSQVTEVSAAKPGPVFTLGSGVKGDPNMLVAIHNLTVSHGSNIAPAVGGEIFIGGGIYVRAGAYLHLFNSVVTQNFANLGAGIAVISPGAPATTISGCSISDNIASGPRPFGGPGGGIAVSSGSKVSIQQSTIARNQSTDGGGIWADSGSSLTIANTTVTSNTANSYATHVGPAGGNGGGLFAGGDLVISDSIFVYNTTTDEGSGGGIYLSVTDNGPHTITRTTLSHNAATVFGAGIFAGGTAGLTFTLDDSYVIQNLAFAGIWTDKVSLVITNSFVRENVGGDICTAGTC
jgi:parallel beta helix pectate lyase-like protein